MIKVTQHIIFDLDGTLTDQSRIFEMQAMAVSAVFGSTTQELQRTIDVFYETHDTAVSQFPEKRSDIAWYMRHMANLRGVEISDNVASELAKVWKETHAEAMNTQVLYGDVIETLQRITNAGHVVCLASGNTRENRINILKTANIDTFFTDVFAAQTIGYQKQQRQFWEIVLNDLGVDPSNLTVVGNQLNDDIQHPLALGMQTILINRHEKLSRKETVANIVPATEISSLTELQI